MSTLREWRHRHENDVRSLLPAVQEQVRAYEEFMSGYGLRHSSGKLARANESKTANERRLRAVLVGLAEIGDRIGSDPNYRVKRAASDAATLRAEYQRLRRELDTIAVQVEESRAISADPVGWSERYLAKFPSLIERTPTLPAL